MVHLLSWLLVFLQANIIGVIVFITLFVMLADALWKKHDFRFSYQFIRWSLLINWAIILLLSIFAWDIISSFSARASGPYWWAYWSMLIGNLLLPILLFNRKIGLNKWGLLIIGVLANIGPMFEKLVIILTSIHQDYGVNQNMLSYLSAWIIPSLVITSFLVSLDVILFRNRKKAIIAENSSDDILDNDAE